MKGQSKALELVIVLFVLVVVAWVVITLFQSLIQEQTQKLQNIQGKEELKGKALESYNYCSQLCNAYLSSSSEKDLIEFCSARVSFDINGDGVLSYAEKSVYPKLSLGGVGVCEDSIPCFAIYECKYGENVITAKTCKEAVCHYFSEVLPVEEDVKQLKLNEVLSPGKCYKATQIFHWYNLNFNSTLSCNE